MTTPTKVVHVEVNPDAYETVTIPSAYHFSQYGITEETAAICQLLDTLSSDQDFSLFAARMERFIEKGKIVATSQVNTKTGEKTLCIQHVMNDPLKVALVCGVTSLKNIYSIFQTRSSRFSDFVLRHCKYQKLYNEDMRVYSYGQPSHVVYHDDNAIMDNVIMRDRSNDVVILTLIYSKNTGRVENATNDPNKAVPYDTVIFKFC